MSDESRRRLSPELHELEDRLCAWATWSRKEAANIGWPAVSLTARMAEWHELGIRPDRVTNGSISIDVPESIWTIDKLVAKLPSPQRRVILVQYFRAEPLEVKARMAHMHCGQYRRILDRARWALHFALNVTA
jgi:DNA-directed RNA polymerase specialized sigma24 family protein